MLSEFNLLLPHIYALEQQGLVTRTFRRLDPQRQQAILDAILEEAVESGPADINIKRVAERAGVAVGSLYQYFGSRENLLAFATELVVRSLVGLLDDFRPYLKEIPLSEALAAYLMGGIEWSASQAAGLRFFAKAAYQGDPQLAETVVRPVAEKMRSIVLEMLTQAAVRGEIRPDIDLEATSRVLHAITIGVGDAQLLPYINNYLQVVDDSVNSERIFNALVTMIIKGIGSE